ncbi:MAG: hypothetical protein KIS92_05610 [Planctomycetota bacterium]|nr:hypothetical protein [Planctomycetota bacterium]
MSELQEKLEHVRAAWRRTELLKGLSVLVADAVIVVLALVALDALYHLPPPVRGGLLAAGAVVLVTAAFVLCMRPLKKQHSREEIALHVEGRFPQLQGTLLAAVDYEERENESEIEADLVDALLLECLDKAAEIDLAQAIDRKRLAWRAGACALLLAFFLGAVAVQPGFFKRELQRVLAPWNDPPPTQEELAAEQRRKDQQEQLAEYLRQASNREAEPLKFEVTPGDVEVERGGRFEAGVKLSRAAGAPVLMFSKSDGGWGSLPMNEDPARPQHYFQTLADVTEDLAYYVAVGEEKSEKYHAKVFDPGVLKELRLTYRYPEYTKLPPATVTGFDGAIDAYEGTQVDVAVVASSRLAKGTLHLSGGTDVPMAANGNEASATLTLSKPGDYGIEAYDVHGKKIPVERRFSIRVRADEPPEMDLLHPAIDLMVHPMEEVVFAAEVKDDVGLKEVRLHFTYGVMNEEVLKLPCNGEKRKVADFVLDLEKRANVQPGDSITFHLEAEDLKGQKAYTDVYQITIRLWESWSFYAGGHHPGEPHPPGDPELISVMGALWDLHTKKGQMTKEDFEKEMRRLSKNLEHTGKPGMGQPYKP